MSGLDGTTFCAALVGVGSVGYMATRYAGQVPSESGVRRWFLLFSVCLLLGAVLLAGAAAANVLGLVGVAWRVTRLAGLVFLAVGGVGVMGAGNRNLFPREDA